MPPFYPVALLNKMHRSQFLEQATYSHLYILLCMFFVHHIRQYLAHGKCAINSCCCFFFCCCWMNISPCVQKMSSCPSSSNLSFLTKLILVFLDDSAWSIFWFFCPSLTPTFFSWNCYGSLYSTRDFFFVLYYSLFAYLPSLHTNLDFWIPWSHGWFFFFYLRLSSKL